jgi:ATP-dependent phosphofructokinase / diphosphate-dependent phosphofructokinase
MSIKNMEEPKRIGILPSGGDCSGLNAVIRAVVNCAVDTYNWEVLGICQATLGLMARPPQFTKLEIDQVDSLLTAGGTMLGTTNKGDLLFQWRMEVYAIAPKKLLQVIIS